MPKKITQEEFLEKVALNNKNDIDYSEFIYNGNNKKGKCKCNVCGHVWETMPMSLFKGHGCPKCAVEYKARKLSKKQDDVIREFKEVHGDDFDYSKVKYINEWTKVEIICPIHGSFWQKPCLHIRGHGCPKCAPSGIKLTQEDFKEKIISKNPLIDLSEFKYVNSDTIGKCKCKKCGYEWETNYKSLRLSTIGCPSCAIKERTKKRADTLETFLEKLYERFPNIDYDFSKSIYVNALSKIEVICKEHGSFFIRPNDLLNGHGCPRCNDSRLEKEVRDGLKREGIEFEQGKHYSWLLNEATNYPLSLDFYLPSEKIAIECQGAQHFELIDHFKGEKGLEKRIYNDKLKKELCEKNGETLLYYLNEEFNKYMKNNEKYFNNFEELIKYIRSMDSSSNCLSPSNMSIQ